MKCVSYFINKETKEQISYNALKEQYQKDFNTYTEFMAWVEQNFDEHEKFIETPYERTQNSVYATGNKWAIENFNATHN